jgi:ABC-type dipeptide/oligopeptide/nickel transport system permease component
MVAMVTALVSVAGSLLTDIFYRLIDPRVRDDKAP